jgi:hypothetical protein
VDVDNVQAVASDVGEKAEVPLGAEQAAEATVDPRAPARISLTALALNQIPWLAALVAFGLVFVQGKAANAARVRAWAALVSPVISSSFASTSGPFSSGRQPDDSFRVHAETAAVFSVLATGRRSVVAGEFTVTLKRRHDLLSLALQSLKEHISLLQGQTRLPEAEDMVHTDLVLPEDTPPMNVMVVSEEHEAVLRDMHGAALHRIGAKQAKGPSALDAGFVVYAEDEDMVSILLTPDMVAALNEVGPARLCYWGVVDCDGPQKVATSRVFLPPASASREEQETVATVASATIVLADRAHKARLTRAALDRANKRRQKLKEAMLKVEQRQQDWEEAAIERKTKRLEEERARVATMSEKEQRKWEEKQAKKKAQPRMRMKMVK